MRITKVVNFIAYLLISLTVIFLLGYTLVEAWIIHSLGGILILVILVGMIIAIIDEGILIRENPGELRLDKNALFTFLGVVIGALVTYILSHDFGLGAVIAACLVGILAYLLFPLYEGPIYCGAFVGMSSNVLFFNHLELFLAALVTGVVTVIAKNVYKGLGGKLGALALIGTLSAGLGLARDFIFQPLPNGMTIFYIIFFSVLITPLTYYLNISRQHGPVMASAIIGLLGGLLLPIIFPETGEFLAVVVICASFIGMTLQTRCISFWKMAAAGLVMGIVIIYATPLLGGAGGKLGSIALIAILAICGYHSLFMRLVHKQVTE